MVKTMPPPISYYGGKQRMASRIIPLIPKHTVYVEPFCGGATLLFRKPWPEVTATDHYREVINDRDERLVNFFRVLRDPEMGKALCERLALTLYSRSEYKIAKACEYTGQDTLHDAWCYYVNIQMSFANKFNGGWGTAMFGRNLAATWTKKVDRLPEYVNRMRSVHIECEDALDVIKRWDSPHTFFYCDPPYPGTNFNYSESYTTSDLQDLVDVLNECEGSFLLSNYDQSGVTFPNDLERHEFFTKMTASRKKDTNKKRTEVVWSRVNRVPVRAEIQKLYDSGKFDCFEGVEGPRIRKIENELERNPSAFQGDQIGLF